MAIESDFFEFDQIARFFPGRRVTAVKVVVIGPRGTLYETHIGFAEGPPEHRYFDLMGRDVTFDYEHGLLEHG